MLVRMVPDLRDPAFIGGLVHFDRAAQRLSFAEAATDLGVTPSAVSHRIAALEAALGKRLFERGTRRVSLTQDGIELAEVTQNALAPLRRVTEALTARQVLRLSVGPYLSSAWLMPRLAEFEREPPGVRVDLLHRAGLPDLRNVDAAIVWWGSLADGMPGEPLFDAYCVPVMAPGAAEMDSFWTSQIQPIHYRDRTLWRQWLAAVGGPSDYAERGEVFEDPNLVLEAAAHGRGVAMGFLPFVAGQIKAGRLVRAHHFAFHSDKRYWLIVTDRENRCAARFRDWITSQAAMTQVVELD